MRTAYLALWDNIHWYWANQYKAGWQLTDMNRQLSLCDTVDWQLIVTIYNVLWKMMMWFYVFSLHFYWLPFYKSYQCNILIQIQPSLLNGSQFGLLSMKMSYMLWVMRSIWSVRHWERRAKGAARGYFTGRCRLYPVSIRDESTNPRVLLSDSKCLSICLVLFNAETHFCFCAPGNRIKQVRQNKYYGR